MARVRDWPNDASVAHDVSLRCPESMHLIDLDRVRASNREDDDATDDDTYDTDSDSDSDSDDRGLDDDYVSKHTPYTKRDAPPPPPPPRTSIDLLSISLDGTLIDLCPLAFIVHFGMSHGGGGAEARPAPVGAAHTSASVYGGARTSASVYGAARTSASVYAARAFHALPRRSDRLRGQTPPDAAQRSPDLRRVVISRRRRRGRQPTGEPSRYCRRFRRAGIM